MVVAGRLLDDGDVAIMMVEAEATPDVFEVVNARRHRPHRGDRRAGPRGRQAGHRRHLQRAEGGSPPRLPRRPLEFPVFLDYDDDVLQAVTQAARPTSPPPCRSPASRSGDEAADAVKDKVKESLAAQFEGRENEISAAFRSLTKSVVRRRIVEDGARIDGRGLEDIRQLAAEVEVLPRVHGSALFERGETQILGVTTLNMLRMEQMVDTLNPESRKRYMHHYNFPPYSTARPAASARPSAARSATGRWPSARSCRCCPARRRSRTPSARVSEALGSNGSTSMGSVCASTMSLLNAGVPLKAPVAGIAMGLVFEGGEYATLTDILGAEDAFGDMDFKVAGTPQFVTALQLDTKLDGIPSTCSPPRCSRPAPPAWRSSRS
jgi:polyribonucleotide nucleotidyltransferase